MAPLEYFSTLNKANQRLIVVFLGLALMVVAFITLNYIFKPNGAAWPIGKVAQAQIEEMIEQGKVAEALSEISQYENFLNDDKNLRGRSQYLFLKARSNFKSLENSKTIVDLKNAFLFNQTIKADLSMAAEIFTILKDDAFAKENLIKSKNELEKINKFERENLIIGRQEIDQQRYIGMEKVRRAEKKMTWKNFLEQSNKKTQ